jgi:hypothetical protein
VRLEGYNEFLNISSTEKHADRVHGAMDRRRGRVHGGPSGGADNCVVMHHRCKARQVLWASKARRRGPGRKRVMRQSRRGAHRSTSSGGEAEWQRGTMAVGQARHERRRQQRELENEGKRCMGGLGWSSPIYRGWGAPRRRLSGGGG